jgi:hypothetical protein
VKTGRLRLLATCGKALAQFSRYAAMIESGFPKVTVTGWWGLVAPAGAAGHRAESQRDTAQVLQQPEQRNRLISSAPSPPAGRQFAAVSSRKRRSGRAWPGRRGLSDAVNRGSRFAGGG